jgi:YidC/Oxa1 family membrane protein insertase
VILASSIIGTVLHPIFVVAGRVLAFFYSLIPNYAIAIALLTVTVMIIVFPLTRMSARSMMRMQLLAPEMKKIQARYKAKPGTPAAERQELRTKMNEEVMALYRENGVNPTGGCLPMFLQFPILIVLYDVVRGLSHQTVVTVNGTTHLVSQPQNIPPSSLMYHHLVASHGAMYAFGINLGDSVRTPQAHWWNVIPYAVMIAIAIGLQYISIWQVTTRNPAATQANPQMQAMQKFMPLIFLVLYIALPAGVGVYFIVSSLFRIAQQEWMYKHDPTITTAIAELNKRKAAEPPPEPAGPRKGLLDRLREAANPASTPVLTSGKPPGKPKPGAKPPGKPMPRGKPPGKPMPRGKPNSGGNSKSSTSQNGSGSDKSTPPAKPQPRAKDKRPRRGQ